MTESHDPPIVRIGTWNTKWAGPSGPKGRLVKSKLAQPKCDVVCVTKGLAGILPDTRNVLKGGQDWGSPVDDDRRKVLLWSARAWTDVDPVGLEGLPGGRFVSGVTQTPAGWPLTIVGVCIPWFDAQWRPGRRDCKRWELHGIWLEEFQKLRLTLPEERAVVLGTATSAFRGSGRPKPFMKRSGERSTGFEIATEGLWFRRRTRGLPPVRGKSPSARPSGWCGGTVCGLRARAASAAMPCPPSG